MMSKMEFDCKIAHLDEIKRLSGFSSVKELYEKVSKAFTVPTHDILYCTLNTHDFRDMSALLGNYLSLGDLIVVHMCGSSKSLNIQKTHEYLGLTITDNGQGRAFVKKVKSNEELIEKMIKPGDHIAGVNSESTIGLRHYEVAKAIREVPEKTTFSLQLIEPKYSMKHLNSEKEADLEKPKPVEYFNTSSPISTLSDENKNKYNSNHIVKTPPPEVLKFNFENSSSNGQISPNCSQLESLYEDLVNSSLPIERFLTRGSHFDENQSRVDELSSQDVYRVTIDKLNTILESFLGINDNLLAIQIYRLAKENKDSFNRFTKAINTSELNVFNFDEDIENRLWTCATGCKA